MSSLEVSCDPATHVYRDGAGRELPGVTTIIGSVIRKQALEIWRGNVGNEAADARRDAAAKRGSLVHLLAEMHTGQVPEIPIGSEPDALAVAAFEVWYETWVEELLASEWSVVNERYGYAGTLDYLVVLRGDRYPTLVDLKTSRSLWPEMRYQTAAYREAVLPEVRTHFGATRCRRGVLHIPQGASEARFVEHTDHTADFQGFLSCLYLFHDLKRGV